MHTVAADVGVIAIIVEVRDARREVEVMGCPRFDGRREREEGSREHGQPGSDGG